MQSPFSARLLPTVSNWVRWDQAARSLRIGQNVRGAVGENQTRSDSDLQIGFYRSELLSSSSLRSLMRSRPHDARNRIAIGDADTGKTKSGWRA